MFQATVRRALFGVTLAAAVGSMAGMIGCTGSGTDGDTGNGNYYVDDGGSGASLKITVDRTELPVAETTAFSVRMADPRGAALEHVRVFCESERGIAILEPSSGGTAFEHTNANGVMSGVLGGLIPGSYLLECRAEEGYNLVDRITMKITGEVPAGFTGWPGAAGGNLGGGLIIDVTPGLEEGLRFSATFQDAGGASTAGPIDNDQIADCDSDVTTVDPEPFEYAYYNLTVTNGSTQDVTIDSVQITVDQDGGPTAVMPTQLFNEFASAGASKTVQGLFVQWPNFTGTTVAPVDGSHRATILVKGTAEDGSSFTLRQTVTVNFAAVDNCSS